MTSITVPSLPYTLDCAAQPQASVDHADTGVVTLSARAGDDLFADPSGNGLVSSASLFTFETTGDFQFSAKVRAEFTASYDSGVLVGYFSEQKWFKICAEIDPRGQKRIVTVVTNGRSDDANGAHLVAGEVYLRVTRTGSTFALHASADAVSWDLARVFTLNESGDTPMRVGIAAQSPAGKGTTATFSEFQWKTTDLGDARDGS